MKNETDFVLFKTTSTENIYPGGHIVSLLQFCICKTFFFFFYFSFLHIALDYCFCLLFIDIVSCLSVVNADSVFTPIIVFLFISSVCVLKSNLFCTFRAVDSQIYHLFHNKKFHTTYENDDNKHNPSVCD